MEHIDGKKLRLLLATLGKRQADVAESAGMDKFTLNRWCNGQIKSVHPSTLAKLAKGLNLPKEDLLGQIAADEASHGGYAGMSPFESEILRCVRELSPLEQSKMMILLDEAVNRVRSSHGLKPR